MPGAAMLWFARRLRGCGFATEVCGYHSIVGRPETAANALAARLRDGPPAHLVGHSLGGLLALDALATIPGLPVRRVVCLGTPVRGSGAAMALSRRAATALYMGRSGAILRRGCASWPAQVEVGMVAGRIPRGLGALLARFDGPHDGTVTVEETRLPALADHVVVAASHSGLLFSQPALVQTVAFLRGGRFRRAAG
ncbi:alpha/beta hydrolase [Luteimonas sp. RD2P54]|uniref:Alpha/beta hydrolase n=1 Tax=Luteimonas endophytica TaxID=3042023 RepID=A0ABT6J607_9GAMM|nr:alpha/beta fold hydrolase [Luteimonas endophytica]MDH5822271.1 alpha/beta hydrolase [Luteimonas endophytica]